MGILNKIKDNFNSAEFTVSPGKKLKTISADFKKSFGVTLVFYKGMMIADEGLTLNQLNQKISANLKLKDAGELKIKASMKVGDAEKNFMKAFNVKVQIKDKTGKKLVPDDMTIGDASRADF